MRKSFNRILLATEGTEFDAGAERVAIDLAATCQLALLVVRPIFSNSELGIVAPKITEATDAEAATQMDQLRQAASKRGVELLIAIRHGEEIHKEILADAREREVDLIVIRRRGKRSYLAKLLLGAMVHKVIDAAECDVLIVPREARIWSRAILVATDGSSHSERATETAVVVAQLGKLPVTVISAAGDGDTGVTAEANVERALALLHGAGARATGRTAPGKPHEAILNAAREIGADLIVLGRRGKGGAERVSLGRTAERVVSNAAGPVLIVRA